MYGVKFAHIIFEPHRLSLAIPACQG